ncbi:MAG: 23S rRNA (adenine(2503)-C(2))-methyltransferase RlmN [Lachnospiraceae bacterium]|nr:23S rRNA (adenine(2503)-C(2))-methyltransferase RlmN [Lachnospiraceae bacterium]MBR6486048.1 23S rRNA (adenine(2503)-C(2))-methyltransferase RlmN [Lachnospiraceae bacterium]
MTEQDIRSMEYDELTALVTGLNEKKFRASQIFDWLHKKQVDSFDDMTNIPKSLREALAGECCISTAAIERVQESVLDGTRKYLFKLCDGNLIESVFMRYEHGNSVCVSTQVGCRMGCRFCASTIDGLVRDLTAGEILAQVYGIIRDTGERVSNVVMMGSGEPLENYDSSVRFIKLISDERGLNLSARNITLSTCGIVPGMRRLADEGLPVTLALSLHAYNDDKRKEIMPVANKYPLNEIMDACRYYFDKTGRRVTFEYSLIGGVNDTDADAAGLSALIGGLNCHVNLIPVNPVKERNYVGSAKSAVLAFKNKLEKNHINVTIRREMGRDIDGACGQLRRRVLKDEAAKATKG